MPIFQVRNKDSSSKKGLLISPWGTGWVVMCRRRSWDRVRDPLKVHLSGQVERDKKALCVHVSARIRKSCDTNITNFSAVQKSPHILSPWVRARLEIG